MRRVRRESDWMGVEVMVVEVEGGSVKVTAEAKGREERWWVVCGGGGIRDWGGEGGCWRRTECEISRPKKAAGRSVVL